MSKNIVCTFKDAHFAELVLREIDEVEYPKLMCDGEKEAVRKGLMLLLDRTPSIDAVPVVRCKECKWGKEKAGNIECNVDINVPSEYHGYEWFCPIGERSEDATN